MIRRPGMVVATAFALGALLGLSASSAFLGVDEGKIRSAVETHASAQKGPLAPMMIEMLDERDIFGPVVDQVRADQRRNLVVATVVAAVASVALGAGFSRVARLEGSDEKTASPDQPEHQPHKDPRL